MTTNTTISKIFYCMTNVTHLYKILLNDQCNPFEQDFDEQPIHPFPQDFVERPMHSWSHDFVEDQCTHGHMILLDSKKSQNP